MTRSEFAQYTQLSDELATLKRKLNDLRTAAERIERDVTPATWMALRTAIEASR